MLPPLVLRSPHHAYDTPHHGSLDFCAPPLLRQRHRGPYPRDGLVHDASQQDVSGCLLGRNPLCFGAHVAILVKAYAHERILVASAGAPACC